MNIYQHVLRIRPEHNARVYFVTDVHGHFSALQWLLAQVGFDPKKDLLLGGGDWVDRGPESHMALQWLQQPWLETVRGNHEDFCLVSGVDGVNVIHAKNGGAWYGKLSSDERAELCNTIASLPYLIEVNMPEGEKIGIVHAEIFSTDWQEVCTKLENEQCLEGSRIESLLLTSRNIIYRDLDVAIIGVDRLYVGHTAVEMPMQIGNIHYCDTGAGKANGVLSLYSLNTHERVASVNVNQYYSVGQ